MKVTWNDKQIRESGSFDDQNWILIETKKQKKGRFLDDQRHLASNKIKNERVEDSIIKDSWH